MRFALGFVATGARRTCFGNAHGLAHVAAWVAGAVCVRLEDGAIFMNEDRKRVVVIGGGISGLATAHRLWELEPNLGITLLESANRIGGVLETVRQGEYLLESGADNFITNVPWAIDLCRRINIESQLLETRRGHRTAFVVRRGRLHKIPQGFIIMAPSRMWPIIGTRILSPMGKLRLAAEYFIPTRAGDADESLAAFVTRRLGREAYDRLVQPLIGGIYTGDPEQLSLMATMPRFREMERAHGSMTRAMLRQMTKKKSRDSEGSGGRYSMFVAPRDGIASMLDAIARRLPEQTIRLGQTVRRVLRKPDGHWQIDMQDPAASPLEADAVVVATQAPAASQLVQELDPQLAGALAEIHHSSCAIVALAFKRNQIEHRMDGFGFVVPIVEQRKILSGSFASVKYLGRAPEDEVVIRVFIGGACQPELLESTDEELRAIATRELAELMGISGEPLLTRIVRYPDTMPQYYVGHRERIQDIETRAGRLGGFFLTGNAYHGVGIPLCIHGGEKTASNVHAYLCGKTDE